VTDRYTLADYTIARLLSRFTTTVLLVTGLWSFVGPGFIDAASAEVAFPNIVLLVGDDHGYGDIGTYGNSVAKTPRLDQMAAEGVQLNALYVSSPVCAPSRAAYLTGRNPSRYGFENPSLDTAGSMGPGLSLNEKILPEFLRERGYATGMFGKWHLGFANRYRPMDRGFDETLVVAAGLNDYFNHYNLGNLDMYLGHNQRPARDNDEYSTTLFVDKTIDFIERHKNQLFFAYVSFTAPHWAPHVQPPGGELPAQAPQEYLDLYPEFKNPRLGTLAATTAMDHEIGRLLDRIDALDLAKNTLVIYFSDHGGQLVRAGGGDNTPLRNGKFTLWEGGIRVPGIVRWEGTLPKGQASEVPITSMDLARYMLNVAGIDDPEAYGSAGPWDGRDPSGALHGNAIPLHDYLGFRFRNMAAIRDSRYKLVGDNQGGQIGGHLRLYDLIEDIEENNNLAGEMPGKVVSLRNTFNRNWRDAINNDTVFP
jgi:arylsulfatase A-like enzyme